MTNQSLAGRKPAKAILSVVISVVLLVTTFVNTAFADTNDKYQVTIVDGASSIVVTTNETEPIEILKSVGIILSADDKLDITAFVEAEGGEIVIDRFNTIYLEIGSEITPYGVYGDTVKEALEEIGFFVTENDKISYQLGDAITNGMVITLEEAIYVDLIADGASANYPMLHGTVADLISIAGVVLGTDDYTVPALDAALEDGMSVLVCRVEYKQETKRESVAYQTKKTNDPEMDFGTEKVVTNGVNGEADVTYKVMYVNGEATSKTEISRNTLRNPVDAEVIVGSKPIQISADVTPNGVNTWNGYYVGQYISGKYTHYCACSICCGNSRGITSSGRKIQNGMPDPYYIACNWLPMGSVLSVDGVNYTVVDRGGSGLSRQGRIDIFTPAGHQECYRLGTGGCSIQIVRLGW